MMTKPPIEFLLHPPSPKRQQCILPPVSSLLSEEQHDLPSLRLPDKQYPSLMLSIPYDPPSNVSSPNVSPYISYQSLDTPQSSPSSSPHPFLLPPPDTTCRSRSHSNASTSSWSSIATSLAVTAPSSPIHNPERRLSDPSTLFQQEDDISLSPQQQPYPSTSTSSTSSTSGDPVVKRKRGRPPNTTRQIQRDHWTFVTPTVWDVKRTQLPEHLQQQQQENHQPSSPSSSIQSLSSDESSKNGVMLVLMPDENKNNNNNQHSRNNIHQNLNTFTSTRMDATLTMPKKKRGRKPKTQLAGNSCFVWRDLTARRGANRVKTTTTNTDTIGSLSSSSSSSTSSSATSSSSLSSTSSLSTNKPLRISKNYHPAPLQIHQQYSNRKRFKDKNEDEDIIHWTKDLTLNDRPTLSN